MKKFRLIIRTMKITNSHAPHIGYLLLTLSYLDSDENCYKNVG